MLDEVGLGARLTYLEGTLEIMSPSEDHETLKKLVARLLEAWADETGTDLHGYGRWKSSRVLPSCWRCPGPAAVRRRARTRKWDDLGGRNDRGQLRWTRSWPRFGGALERSTRDPGAAPRYLISRITLGAVMVP